MQKFRNSLLLTFSFLAIAFQSQAQDPHFTQFYLSPLTLNPALTGMYNADARVGINYRNQWATVTVPYQTFSAFGDGGFFKNSLGGDFVGGGLVVTNDVAGDANLRNTSVALSGAYHKSLSDENNQFLSAGFQMGMVQRSINFSKLFFDNQIAGGVYDPNLVSGENLNRESMTLFDLNAGLSYYWMPDDRTNMYFGASLSHITAPNQSFLGDNREQLNRKLTLHGGAEFPIGSSMGILPSVIYLKQGAQSELNLGASLKFRLGGKEWFDDSKSTLYLGLMHRVGDAFIFTSRVDIGGFTIGLSFDMNTSNLNKASKYIGGPELAVGYRFGLQEKSGGLKCPAFN